MSAPDVLVGVENVDVLGARGVRLAGDRAGERRVLEQALIAEYLPGLEVEADLDDEPRVALETLIGCRHGGEL